MADKETFRWKIESGGQIMHKFDVRTVSFGDGYEQRQRKSLRAKLQSWDARTIGTKQQMAQIIAFFDRHGGSRAFWWQAPGREKVLVKVTEYQETPLGGQLYRLSWKFEEVIR